MLPEPTIAKFKVEGYATFSSLFLKFTVVSGNSVYRVVLSLRRIPKRLQLKFQTRTKRRIEERVVKSQTKIKSCMNCIVIIYFLACQDDSQSCRRSPRGECWNKAEDHAKGPIRGKLPVTIVYLCLTFSA